MENELIDKLLKNYKTLEDVIGENGLLAQLTKRILERAPTPRVSYLTQDHLGSPRVVTDQNGAVIKRTDWMTFGAKKAVSGNVSTGR